MDVPSGDQMMSRMLTSSWAIVDSVPSEIQRTMRSLPCCAPSVPDGLLRTNATRLALGDGTKSLPRSSLLHTRLGVLPVTGTFHKSPSCGKYTVSLSSFQNAPSTWPSGNEVSACGWPWPSAFARYRFATPARSQTYTICLPSGDQTGFEGCLISPNCSIVSREGLVLFCAAAEATKDSDAATIAPTALFHLHITPPQYANAELNSNTRPAGWAREIAQPAG